MNTVMVYKFPKLSREVIEAMFSISELKQTRVYRDAVDEGRDEGRVEGQIKEAQSLILRQLVRWFGSVDQATESHIRSLSLSRLEDLGEALLEFSQFSELKGWLKTAWAVSDHDYSLTETRLLRD
jgi:predicted transposase YdaD